VISSSGLQGVAGGRTGPAIVEHGRRGLVGVRLNLALSEMNIQLHSGYIPVTFNDV
jgi:hypothetical protein